MAKKKQSASKAKLLNKLKRKAKGAWNKARETEGKARGSQLPGGIVKGVAKLTSWKLDEDKNHNPYFVISGTVKEPEEFEGLRASVMHFISESQYATVEEKLEKLASDIQLLGGETDEADLDDLPNILADLVEAGPHFFYNTSEFKRNDGSVSVSVFIQGLAEDWDEEDSEEEEPEEEAEEDEEEYEEEYEEEEEEVEEDEEEEASEEEDEEEEGEDEEAEEEEDWEPEKAEIYLYKATPRGKPQECKVTAVQKRAQTVNLQRLSDKKAFKGIEWDKLQDVEE